MQNDLDKICDWLNHQKLSFNTSKCETMSFGSTQQIKLTIHNKPVSQKTCFMYLGVFIVSKLTIKDHINHVVKKLLNYAV